MNASGSTESQLAKALAAHDLPRAFLDEIAVNRNEKDIAVRKPRRN
jgi:hypothetical protein